MSAKMSVNKNLSHLVSKEIWQVLLVEDDPLMQLGLEQFFADFAEYTVIGQANNGYRAV